MPKTTVHGGPSNEAADVAKASPPPALTTDDEPVTTSSPEPAAEGPDNDESGRPSPPVTEEGDDAPELAPEPAPVDYGRWTRKELADELKARGLPVSGTKDEQIGRLKANEPED